MPPARPAIGGGTIPLIPRAFALISFRMTPMRISPVLRVEPADKEPSHRLDPFEVPDEEEEQRPQGSGGHRNGHAAAGGRGPGPPQNCRKPPSRAQKRHRARQDP